MDYAKATVGQRLVYSESGWYALVEVVRTSHTETAWEFELRSLAELHLSNRPSPARGKVGMEWKCWSIKIGSYGFWFLRSVEEFKRQHPRSAAEIDAVAPAVSRWERAIFNAIDDHVFVSGAGSEVCSVCAYTRARHKEVL